MTHVKGSNAECGAARNPMIQIGSEELPLLEFMFLARQWFDRFRGSPWLDDTECSLRLSVLEGIVNRRPAYNLRASDILTLLMDFRAWKATDSRHKVFALLGMANLDPARIKIRPDYHSSVSRVYHQVTVSLISSPTGLDVLSVTRTDANIARYVSRLNITRVKFLGLTLSYLTSRQLPSWVADWSHDPVDEEPLRERAQPSSIDDFCAAGPTQPILTFDDDDQILRLFGHIFDEVEDVTEPLLYVESEQLGNPLRKQLYDICTRPYEERDLPPYWLAIPLQVFLLLVTTLLRLDVKVTRSRTYARADTDDDTVDTAFAWHWMRIFYDCLSCFRREMLVKADSLEEHFLDWHKFAMRSWEGRYANFDDRDLAAITTICACRTREEAAQTWATYTKFRKSLRAYRPGWKRFLPPWLSFARLMFRTAKMLLGVSLFGKSMAVDLKYEEKEYIPGRRARNKRLARTKDGNMALMPGRCRPGDIITLFKGGAVPLVIRKVEDTSKYILVGEAYVYGIMHGEAWDAEKCHDIDLI